MTIELLLTVGILIGLTAGYFISDQQKGCLALLIVPAGMIGYVFWWQMQNNTHDALSFLFGPLWPSLGAAAGYFIGRFLRSWKSSDG